MSRQVFHVTVDISGDQWIIIGDDRKTIAGGVLVDGRTEIDWSNLKDELCALLIEAALNGEL